MNDLPSTGSLRGSSVTITGGTGSFGHAMTKHLLKRDVGSIRIFSRDEAKQDRMRRELNDDRLRFFIGDVRDEASVRNAIDGVDYVFHAAALKQVPSCEFFPDQAVKTNVMGSFNVVNASIANQVQAVVCLSTDKAVYPVNAMGMSKAMMEKIALAAARNHLNSPTRVAVTRYGNVLLSRGSVIPLFVHQVLSGKQMTITEPTMTRFLMSLDESVELVEHAFTHASQGDLFVRKAPAATIDTLARAVASALGVEDPDIRVIGVRHGEKLHETLLSVEEITTSTDQGDYYRVPLDARSLNYELFFEKGETQFVQAEDYTSHSTVQLSVEQTKQMILALPDFHKIVASERHG
ncbi:SDR family NAD(P)-dependent oxidoreductase [Nocardioides sp. cx-169]|uniref:SDR family NAD(P)-dependent oxidoreductase n=1 Tax=Nocardioides sp. cx-169 TaxID=2899080 RepID=UPI001E397AEA|nr:SDR family NAD(P)-dependent oxidoreductase [Nocardioides sp. cx-169]MCD4533744.1 SDR family NAD(P)-dependent oxidoreductase [Nocardioides sp. cx-169]